MVMLLRKQQVLEKGGVDAAITFQLKGGYELLMSFFNTAFCNSVAAVLCMAGCCRLYNCGPTRSSSSTGTAAPRTGCATVPSSVASIGRLRIRWPSWVLFRLSTAVCDGFRADRDGSGKCGDESKLLAQCETWACGHPDAMLMNSSHGHDFEFDL